MSIATEVPPISQNAGSNGRSFETWSWLFMRLSGLVLLFLALLHFSITHIVNDVVETNSGFVANRWSNPFWRIYDWLLLVLALLHGLNGLRVIVNDYVSHSATRVTVKVVLSSITAGLMVLGTWAVVTFP